MSNVKTRRRNVDEGRTNSEMHKIRWLTTDVVVEAYPPRLPMPMTIASTTPTSNTRHSIPSTTLPVEYPTFPNVSAYSRAGPSQSYGDRRINTHGCKHSTNIGGTRSSLRVQHNVSNNRYQNAANQIRPPEVVFITHDSDCLSQKSQLAGFTEGQLFTYV